MGSSSSAKPSPADGGGKDGAKKMGGEDEGKIVKLLHKLFEQWGEMVGSDQDKAGLVQKMSTLLDQYDSKFMQGKGKDSSTQPSAPEAQGPTPPAAAAAGGDAAQPMPA
jgi:hypothetical protein